MHYKELDTSTKIIIKVIFAFLALAFFWAIRDVVLIFILSLILASALGPLVDFLKQRQIPRAVSAIMAFALFIGLVALLAYFLIPVVVEQFKLFTQNLPTYLEAMKQRIGPFAANFNIQKYFDQTISEATGGSAVVNSTFGIVNGFIGVISVLFISFYLLAEEKGLKSFVRFLLPDEYEGFVINILEKIQHKIGLWVLGQIIVCIVMFVITFVGLTILNVPYALILAFVAGLLEVIPYVGPLIAAIPAVLISLLVSPTLAFAAAILYFLLHEFEANVLIPKVMQKTVGISPLAILLAMLTGFKLAGIVGIIMSVPLVGALTVVISEFWARRQS